MELRGICIGLLCILLGQRAWCEEASRAAKAATVEPFPEVVAMARTNQIPVSGFDSLGEPGRLQAGDSFTALITHFEKGSPRRQWLLYLQTVEPDSTVKTNPPKPMVLYTSSGAKHEFMSQPATVTLRTIGPFGEPGGKRLKAEDETARFTLDKGFLSLGLDRTVAAVLAMNQVKTEMPFSISSQKFTDAQIEEGRKAVAARGITAGDERALAGSIPALTSYFAVVQETKGLEGIMLKVVDKPSIWSIIKNRGVRADLEFDTKRFASVDPESWGIPTRPPAYDFAIKMTLNGHLAANAVLVVTTPRPPLLPCGGIVGFIVTHPKDPGNFLASKILSARSNKR